MLGGGGCQGDRVGRRRDRQRVGRSWLADGLEEPLQATAGRLTVGGGRADHERARRVGQHSERVSCAAGHESERTRTSEDELTFDLELDLDRR